MPEGDVLHRLAATFDRLMVGRRCAVSSPQGRFASSAARIDGWTMTQARAVGKHLFLRFESPARPGVEAAQWLHVHLGLYGSWRFAGDGTLPAPSSIGAPRVPAPTQAGRGAHGTGGAGAAWTAPAPIGLVRVRMVTDHVAADLTGPTRCELVSDAQRVEVEARLGPDPLAPGAPTDLAARARFVHGVRTRRRFVGELVMDQSVVAGVGNIYRSESLFLAGISPLRRGDRVAVARLRDLWEIICRLMAHGLAAGRIETVEPHDAPEPPLAGDAEASRWYVYHRGGRPCLRCGHAVRERLMQGRRLFWCPSCQR